MNILARVRWAVVVATLSVGVLAYTVIRTLVVYAPGCTNCGRWWSTPLAVGLGACIALALSLLHLGDELLHPPSELTKEERDILHELRSKRS